MKLKKGLPDFAGKVACVHLVASSGVLVMLSSGHFTDNFAVLWPLFLCLSFPLLLAFMMLTMGPSSTLGALVGVVLLCANSFLVGHIVARTRAGWRGKRKSPSNKTPEATSEPAPGAGSSAPQG